MSDLDGVCLIKLGGRLTGADLRADEFLAGIKERSEVIVTIRRPRNPKHHRLAFAVMKKVVDNCDLWPSVEILLDDLKLATGHAELRINAFTGERQFKAKSINFAAMSQDEFRPWFDKVIDKLAGVLGTESEALLAEVLAMVEPRKDAA
jgi:hypothetical protein